MLYAASIKISAGKNHRRLNLVVEAANREEAEIKALKQARKMVPPNKKTIYTLIALINETEAIEAFSRTNSVLNQSAES